jgi:Putative adhesin
MHAQRRLAIRPLAALGALLTVLACPGLAAAQQAAGSFERTLTVSGPVDLEVLTGSGRIDVRTGQAGKIEVTGRIKAGDWGNWGLFGSRLSPDERVRRLEAKPPIEQSGNRISVGRIEDDDVKNVSISYTLVVPPDTTLTSKTGSGSHLIEGLRGGVIASSGSGSIRVRDVGGNVKASTGSGSIQADAVGGSFSANSGSGSINGTNVHGGITVKTGSGGVDVAQSGNGAVEASSGSGSIRLTGIHGSLRASTSSGTLRVQGEQTTDWHLSASSGSVTVELTGKPAFTLDARSNSGHIDTQYPITVGQFDRRALRGSVNGGGPLLHVRTSSGGIRIR